MSLLAVRESVLEFFFPTFLYDFWNFSWSWHLWLKTKEWRSCRLTLLMLCDGSRVFRTRGASDLCLFTFLLQQSFFAATWELFFLVPRLEIIIYMKRNNVAVESWRKRVLTRRGLCLRTCRAWDLSFMVDVMKRETSLMQRMKQIILRPFSLSFVSNFTGCEKNSVCENEINRRRTEIAMKMESWWRKIHDEVKLAID